MAAPSLLGKNPELPYDLQTEQEQLAVAQLIATELLKQGMTDQAPAIPIGGGAVIPNWGNITASGAALRAAKSQLGDIATKQGDLAGRYNAMLAEAMDKYTKTRFGTPDIPAAAPPGQEPVGPPQPGQRPDLVSAIKYAAGSRLPAMQALAAADIKEAPGGKDYLQYGKEYGSQGLGDFAPTLDPTKLTPMPQYHQAGDVGVTTVGGVPTATTPTATYDPSYIDPKSQLLLKRRRETGEETALSPNFPANAVTGWEALRGKLTEESLAQTKLAHESLRSIGQIQSDLESIPPNALGAGSEFKLAMDKWIRTLGGPKLDWTQKLEDVKGQIDNIMAAKIRLFAPVSDPDIAIARGMVGGNFTYEGMKMMLAYLRQQAEGVVQNHKQTVDAYIEDLPAEKRPAAIKMLMPYFNPQVVPPTPMPVKPTKAVKPTNTYPPGGGSAPITDWRGDSTITGASGKPLAQMSKQELEEEFIRQGGKRGP